MLLHIIKIVHLILILFILFAPLYNENYLVITIVILGTIIYKWNIYGSCFLTKLEYYILGHENESKGFIYRLINPFINIEADRWKIIMERASIVWLILLILIYIIKYK
jgi:hypothetical protein